MPRRRTAPVRCLIPCLALTVALAGLHAPAFAAPTEVDFEQLLAEADAHTLDGRPAEALDAYERAYAAMPPELRATAVGELVVLAAGKAAFEAHRRSGDTAVLLRGRALLVSFITEVSARPDAAVPSLDSARSRLEELEAEVPEPEPAPPPPPPEPEPEPELQQPVEPSDEGPRRQGQSKVGLALAVSGGAATLGGLGLVIAGSRQVPWFEGKIEELGWTPDHPDYAAEAAKAERTRNIDIGVGAAVMVVGIGLGVTGAVLMTRHRKQAAVAWSGTLLPGGGGVAARVRF
ncbi:MAG: hypothetical protein AB1Z98_17335 [Nannocystaceae bacterium]